MNQIDAKARLIYSRVTENMKLCLVTGLICGLITHGFMLFNKITYWDDVHLMFSIGGTYKNGRWLLGLMEKFNSLIWGHEYSIPSIKGMLTIILIAIASYVVIDLLKFNSKTSIVLVACLMQVFPCIAVLFRYMYCSYAYALALLLAVLVPVFIDKGKKGYAISTALIVCVFAIYQAYISVVCIMFLMLMMQRAIDEYDGRHNIITALKWVSSLVLGLVVYFVLNKCFLFVTREHLTSYQGIDSMQTGFIAKVVNGLVESYYYFGLMYVGRYQGLSHNVAIRLVLWIVSLVATVAIITCIVRVKDIINKVILGMLFIAIPVAINIIYVMVGGTANAYIHGLMIYSTVFVFIIPIMLVETLSQKQNLLENVKKLHLEYVVCFMSIVTIIYYGVFDNVAYLQADLLQHNLESYFTTFITQIKSAEGYDASYPIILVQNANRSGRYDFNDESAYYKEEIADLGLTAYSGELKGALPGYSAIAFMEYMCGFDAGKIVDYNQSLEAGKIEQIEEQQDMPCYPTEGSIRVIGDKIVIKLSDID